MTFWSPDLAADPENILVIVLLGALSRLTAVLRNTSETNALLTSGQRLAERLADTISRTESSATDSTRTSNQKSAVSASQVLGGWADKGSVTDGAAARDLPIVTVSSAVPDRPKGRDANGRVHASKPVKNSPDPTAVWDCENSLVRVMPCDGVHPDVPSNTLDETRMDAAVTDVGTRPVDEICAETLKVPEGVNVFVGVPGRVDGKVPEKVKLSLAVKTAVITKLVCTKNISDLPNRPLAAAAADCGVSDLRTSTVSANKSEPLPVADGENATVTPSGLLLNLDDLPSASDRLMPVLVKKLPETEKAGVQQAVCDASRFCDTESGGDALSRGVASAVSGGDIERDGGGDLECDGFGDTVTVAVGDIDFDKVASGDFVTVIVGDIDFDNVRWGDCV